MLRVSATDLMRYLQVTNEALFDWEVTDLLLPLPGVNPIAYDAAAIDAFLRECKQSFDPPLTIADLLEGNIALTTRAELASMLGVTLKTVEQHITKRNVRSLRLPGLSAPTRVEKGSAIGLTYQQTAHILGRSYGTVVQLVSKGTLQATNRRPRRIAPVHIAAYLQPHLPDWIEPLAWIKRCLESTQDLLTYAQVCELLGERSVKEGVKAKQLWYVKYRLRLFCPDSVTAWSKLAKDPKV